jgi:UDP-N-acetylmuramate--alanine ligase
VPDKKNIPSVLLDIQKEDDIIITMGAGDIWKFGEKYVEMLKKNSLNE